MPLAMLKSLTPGLSVRNWTAKSGYLGDSFSVEAITFTRIEVQTPVAKNLQLVPLRDFEAVVPLWQGYCAGAVQRQQLRDVTRYSKYIISILHHLENTARSR